MTKTSLVDPVALDDLPLYIRLQLYNFLPYKKGDLIELRNSNFSFLSFKGFDLENIKNFVPRNHWLRSNRDLTVMFAGKVCSFTFPTGEGINPTLVLVNTFVQESHLGKDVICFNKVKYNQHGAVVWMKFSGPSGYLYGRFGVRLFLNNMDDKASEAEAEAYFSSPQGILFSCSNASQMGPSLFYRLES